MTVLITRKDWEALPEGAPFELCDGMLVRQPSPRFGHQRIRMRLLQALTERLGAARVAAGPLDVLVDELNVFVPDVFLPDVFLPDVFLPDVVVLRDMADDEAPYVGVPVAVCEVLSPSTRGRDRDSKARRYLGLGVQEVWLVDREREVVEVVDLDGCRESAGDTPARSRALEGFALVPADLFARPA